MLPDQTACPAQRSPSARCLNRGALFIDVGELCGSFTLNAPSSLGSLPRTLEGSSCLLVTRMPTERANLRPFAPNADLASYPNNRESVCRGYDEEHLRLVMRILAVGELVLIVGCPSVFGIGFRTPDQNARSTGQAEAFIAQADDASAIHYNPGGLTQLRGSQIMAGVYAWLPSFGFDGAAGNEEMDTVAFLPHLYAASDFGLNDWRFGIGLNNAFGTGMDWGDTSSFRFLITKASLSVMAISPTAAYQINRHLSAGVSLNVYRGDLEWERCVSFAPVFVGDGEFKVEGDGWAVGATAGLLWKINDKHSVGLTYRSPFSVDFEGDARIKLAPAGLRIDTGPSDARAAMDFPQMAAVGYAFRPTPKLKLEADVEWVNWDTLNDVKIHSKNPSFDSATVPSATIPFYWKDTFSYRLGGEYRLSDQWTVRAGYVFWDNSVPDHTFSPLLPDSDLHSFACGVGYAAGRWGVDVSYQYNLWESRAIRGGSVNSPFVDGNWDLRSHAVILTTWVSF